MLRAKLICPGCFVGRSIESLMLLFDCLSQTKEITDSQLHITDTMDDHFYNSDPSRQRWSDLRRRDDHPMESHSNYREINTGFKYDRPDNQQSRPESMSKHRDDDPMEGPSTYKEIKNHFSKITQGQG